MRSCCPCCPTLVSSFPSSALFLAGGMMRECRHWMRVSAIKSSTVWTRWLSRQRITRVTVGPTRVQALLEGQRRRVVEPVSDPVVEDKCPVIVLLVVVLLLLFCSALLENLPDFSVWGFVVSFVRQFWEIFSILAALDDEPRYFASFFVFRYFFLNTTSSIFFFNTTFRLPIYFQLILSPPSLAERWSCFTLLGSFE